MSDSQDEFGSLMERVREGSQSAAQELFARYGRHVLRVVRRRLSRDLRPKFDSHDFAQAVWASFFALPSQKYQFNGPEELIAFLETVARHKVIEVARQRLQGQRYNVNRECSLDGLHPGSLDSSPGPLANILPGREPTPSQVAIAKEEWERLLEGQPAHYQRILVLLRNGRTNQEIAEELGLEERTIRRVIRKLFPERTHERA